MEKLWNISHKESRAFGGGINMISRVEIIRTDNFIKFEDKINACIMENLGNVRDIKFCVNSNVNHGTGYYAMVILEE